MTTSELVSSLRNLDCRDCPEAAQCVANPTGCYIVGLAINKIVSQEDEKAACFRLGQMDMRESAAAKLRDAAANVYGIARATLESAADLIDEMETMK